jgi:hypothetical protein
MSSPATPAAPRHPPMMSMPSQTPEVSEGSTRNHGHGYLQRVSKQTLVKMKMEMTSK